jgi:hypothetical protein
MTKEIDKLLDQAYAKITEAETLADQTGTRFDFSLRYGMGGTYYPKPVMTKSQALDLLKSGKDLTSEERKIIAKIIEGDDDDYDGHEGWVSSSQQC